MTSFMGPMAPPPAAPAQPQALDIRTDPNQRQQFKQFMRQRTSMAPMVSAPIAQPQPPMPMMQPPMPMPMGQDIDIFNPVNLHEGGIVPSLNSLQQQASQFAEQLQSTIMGGGQGGGMGAGMSGGTPSAQLPSPPSQPGHSNMLKEMSPDSPYFNVPAAPFQGGQTRPATPELPFQAYTGGSLGSLGSLGQNMFGFNDGGAVPPRETDIRGMHHELSYITPDEADILMALGGSGEAGPMGIPAFRPGGDDGQGNVGGDAPGGDVGTAGDGMGEGQGQGAGQGMGGVGDPSDDNASDDEMGDVGIMDGPSSPSDEDDLSDSTDVATDQERAAEIAGQMAARNRAIRDAFVTTTSGKPIGTPGSPSGKFGGNLGKTGVDQNTVDKALDALVGVPGSRENLAAAAATNAVEAVSGVPTDPLSSSNKGLLLGLDPKDLLAIENFSYAPPAQTNVSLSRNPSSLTGKVSAPSSRSALGMSPVESMARFGNPNMAGMTQSQIDNFTEQGLVTDVAPVASAPSSNVVAASVDPLTQDPMTVARAMQGIQAPGLMDLGFMSNIGKGLQSLVGSLTGAPTQEEINAAYANRSPDLVGISPGLAIAALGVDKGIPAAGMIGMTPDGKPAAITGDMLADINTRSQDDPLGLNVLSGFFNDRTLSDASASKVAVVDPATNTVNDTQGRIVGAIDGYGRYTGNPDFNPYAGPQGQGGDGPDQTVKPPTDPCPDGFVMKNGACTPIETDTGSDFPNQIGGMTPGYNAPPVIVPSSRFQGYSLQGPVGYGSPIAGQAAPSVATNAAMYQQMMSQGMRPPLRLEDGGAVPPRNVEISGQDHMLSYITPDEADILKALGGSGNPGPMGIPSFEDGGDANPYKQGESFYLVPAGRPGPDQEYKKVFFGTNQDTMENRIAGSSDLAGVTSDMVGGPPQAVNRDEYLRQHARDLAKLRGQPDPYPDPVPVVPDLPAPMVSDPAPTDPNAYNPIMDVVVPSTRLQDFPASAPPSFIGQPVPMPLQGPVGYGSPEVGQMAPSVVSNAAMYQDMLSQPFPLNFQQGGSVSSNLDMAADNFLKALMPAA
jgi:hypothetical protein